MTDDKPLHVRVAEALGWFAVVDASASRGGWYAARPGDNPKMLVLVPRYGTDWSATGPLIEKYGMTLAKRKDAEEWLAAPQQEYVDEHDGYLAYVTRPFALGPTQLIAVCNLILALKAAGKL